MREMKILRTRFLGLAAAGTIAGFVPGTAQAAQFVYKLGHPNPVDFPPHPRMVQMAAAVKAESNGNSRAVSRAGARGLMQLMPGTATELGVNDSFEPGQNVRGGSAYLDELLRRYHDNIALALAAYNAGPAAVDKYHGIPPYHETRAYVARVIHEFNRRVLARRNEPAGKASAQQSIAAATSLQASSSR